MVIGVGLDEYQNFFFSANRLPLPLLAWVPNLAPPRLGAMDALDPVLADPSK